MFCDKCGANLVEGSGYCTACGAKLEGQGVFSAASQPGAAVPPPPPAQDPPPPPPPSYSPDFQAPPPSPGFRPAATQPAPSAYPQSYSPQSYQGVGRPAVGEVLSVGQYIGMFLLLCIPFLNFILLLLWSLGATSNLNKRNFARASLLLSAIMIFLWIIAGGAIMGMLSGIMDGLF